MEEEMAPERDFVTAHRVLTNMMLGELVEALIARGSLKGADVAGMLLRVEERAKIVDELTEEHDDPLPSLAAIAEKTTEEWTSVFALQPEVYALRLRHKEWGQNGKWGRVPFAAERVAALFPEDEAS